MRAQAPSSRLLRVSYTMSDSMPRIRREKENGSENRSDKPAEVALFALPQREADLLRHYTLSDEDLQNIGARRRPSNKLGFALQLCVLPLTRAACWLRASSFRRPPSWISSDASSTWMETNSPTTRCGPRPDTSILPNGAACTDSGPSRAARRMSSGTGAAKKRHGRSRTRTWCAGSSRPAVTRETILPATTTIERICADALVDAERRIDRWGRLTRAWGFKWTPPAFAGSIPHRQAA